MTIPMSPVRRLAAVLGVLLAVPLVAPASAGGADGPGGGPKPTVVLVHGAWADASGWGGVTERLQRQGYTVLSPANPLRSVEGDAMAKRAGATTREVASSHVPMISHPDVVTDLITDAARGIG